MNSMNPDSTPPPSLPSLLRDLRDETTTLLRQEIALAKSELKENASKMGTHATSLGIGALVAYAGFIILLIGISHFLEMALIHAGVSDAVSRWLAPCGVGLIVAIIGWVMVSKATTAFKKDDLTPKQTAASLHETKDWAQSKLPTS